VTFLLRSFSALVLATLLTGTLFWFLAILIKETVDTGELRQATRIDFTRMRRDSEVESRREEQQKPEREKPAVVPSTPRLALAATTPGAVGAVQMLTPTIDTSGLKLNIGAGGSDREVTPLVRINPEYPRRALQRNIEGWVQLQFAITAAGTVKDVTIVDSEPKKIFDEAAVQAVQRWRYNPRVVDGVAVERVGVRVLLRFELEE
jgi:periplasmic protein TonB